MSCSAYNPWAHWKFFRTVALRQHFHFQWVIYPTISDHIENPSEQFHCGSIFTFNKFFSLQSLSTLKILWNSCTVPVFSLLISCLPPNTISDHIENPSEQLHCSSIFTFNTFFSLQCLTTLKIFYNSCTTPVLFLSMSSLPYNPRAHWKFFRTVPLRQYFHCQWVVQPTILDHIENSLKQLHCASIFTFNDLFSLQSMSTLKILQNSCTAPVFSLSMSSLAYNLWAHWKFFTTVAPRQYFHFQWIP